MARELALEVATTFVTAARAGRFDDALALTTARWRDHLTQEQFRADFELEPLAVERLARLERALENGVRVSGERAELSLAGSTVLVLLRVDGSWRVDALTR